MQGRCAGEVCRGSVQMRKVNNRIIYKPTARDLAVRLLWRPLENFG